MSFAGLTSVPSWLTQTSEEVMARYQHLANDLENI